MTDFIVILIIALTVGLAAGYVYRAKKRGEKCMGCPAARSGACKRSCCGGDKK